MDKTPKSLRLQIGIFGRTNVGKSSFLNMVAGQDVAITSPVPGTTTDVVEKTMELLPLGPVVFLDTAGMDDKSVLSELRLGKTKKIFDRSDFMLLVTEADIFSEFEEKICLQAHKRKIPLIIIVNKIDLKKPSSAFLNLLKKWSDKIILANSIEKKKRDDYVNPLKKFLIELCPEDFLKPPSLIGDLIPAKGLALLIIPIDFEAPKGRIILPQVQTIRDALDNNAAALIVKESEYEQVLKNLKTPPDIVVCDSQVVHKMVCETPKNIKCTTFSILFARYKGDLAELARGAASIEKLKSGDKVLIAEGCSHHPIEGDIGRVKIPGWVREHTGLDIKFDTCAGRDYPENLKEYKLVILCGSCMLTRRETLFRIEQAKQAGVPVTNYGLCISVTQGVLERVLEPFPDALLAYSSVSSL